MSLAEDAKTGHEYQAIKNSTVTGVSYAVRSR